MMKHIGWIVVLALAGCGVWVPPKYQSPQISSCAQPGSSLQGVPFTRSSRGTCAVALAPFDVGAWHEAAFNSHKVRGEKKIKLGCRPLTPAAADCEYTGLQGHSRTLMLNFDPSVYPEKAAVQRAVLAVYAFTNPQGLKEAQVRGRLSVGGELESLASQREVKTGWVLFDVTAFAARAINERRNSVLFEISQPCQADDQAPVTVGLLNKEPRLVVEFE